MNPVLVNGIAVGWNDIIFILYGVPVTGIMEINYDVEQEKGNGYGAGKEPVYRTYGQKKYNASITIYADELKQIINNAPGKDPLAIPMTDVIISYNVIPYSRDILRNFEFIKHGLATKAGDTHIPVTIPCIFAGLDH